MSPSLQTMGFFMSDINFCNTKEQLNHLGEVVTGKVDGSPTGADIDTSTLPYTGQVRKTLPALEGEYEQSITDKEVEADAAIDSYRLLNKGPYSSGITLESKFEFITYNGESYFATNPPYATTATTPDNDGNLFVGGYVNESLATQIAENVLEENISTYTDIVYKASGGNSAVENMVAGIPIAANVSNKVSTGNTTWIRKSDSSGDITDFEALGDAHSIDWGISRDGAQSSIDWFASTTSAKNLIFGGSQYPASASPLVIDNVGKSIVFRGPNFDFDIHFYRCVNCDYSGNFITTGDVRNIGLLKSNMPSFTCNLHYIQNFAGWGGVNFANFAVVNAKASQVRQAKLVGSVSSINEVLFEGLYCQGSSSTDTPSNYWGSKGFNFWIRGAESNVAGAPVYTEDGTEPSLSGTDKWEDEITTSPFTVIHGDFSYAEDGFETWGVKSESSRPIMILSDFIEGHDHTTEGNIVRVNAEDRAQSALNVSGDFDVITNLSNTQKWGNYKVSTQPIYDNYEFKRGLDGISASLTGTGGGLVDISGIPGDTQSTSDKYIKIVNTGQSGGARFTYSFTAKKSGRIQVGVRGKRTGFISVQVGSNPTLFGLGYKQDDSDSVEAYSVASALVQSAGELVTVTVWTNGFSTPDTGDVSHITGFGVFYGSHTPTLYQEDLEFTGYTVQANDGVAEDLFTIDEGTFQNRFRRVTILTHNIVAGGGGEKIVLDIGSASGGSSVAVSVNEISRTSVDGVGGTGDDSGTLAISSTTSGTSYTIKGTLADVATVNVTSRVGEYESAQ